MSRLINYTWRYKGDVLTFCGEDEAGVAKFYYGIPLGDVAVFSVELTDSEQAEALYKFIMHISTEQWNRGYKSAIEEMEVKLKELKEE